MSKGTIALLALAMLLTGCWDRVEIEERGTVLALAIDPASEEEAAAEPLVSHPKGAAPASKKGNLLKVTAQLAIPGQIPLGPESGGAGGNGAQDKVWVVSAVGHTMDDALQNLQQSIANELFFGHLQVVILNRNIAENGIDDINEYLRRMPEIRRTVWLVVNHTDAAGTMTVSPKLERVPALYFAQTFRQATKMGKLPASTMGRFWIDRSKEGKDGFLPYITVKNKENIEVSGVAYFRDDKMQGVLRPHEVAYFNGLTEQNPGGASAYITVPGTGGEAIMFQSVHRDARYKLSFRGGRPHFDVYVTVKGIVKEKSSIKVDLEKPEDVAAIEQGAEEQFRKAFESVIRKTQAAEADIFGFGDQIRAFAPGYWDARIREAARWHQQYEQLSVSVHPTIRIIRMGMSPR
ncbi:Ger(x)C family spore germination protein [Paenibacillus sp.]|uniref:Ger(x)C family spore germination protein n=1 Tax=Paenibacillus sp. TaxID=58172 RepID=UPI002D60AD64|nr:Ger(x)C family spore germination protein [Paenibacillus sp.]HZG85144.1 Ger(x)C family spore germination protein [Paenibacillus sp.]